jgi:hypothetical protein
LKTGASLGKNLLGCHHQTNSGGQKLSSALKNALGSSMDFTFEDLPRAPLPLNKPGKKSSPALSKPQCQFVIKQLKGEEVQMTPTISLSYPARAAKRKGLESHKKILNLTVGCSQQSSSPKSSFPLCVAIGALAVQQHKWMDGFLAWVTANLVGPWLGAWTVFANASSKTLHFFRPSSALMHSK